MRFGGRKIWREEWMKIERLRGHGEQDRRTKDDRSGQQDLTHGMLIANSPGSRT